MILSFGFIIFLVDVVEHGLSCSIIIDQDHGALIFVYFSVNFGPSDLIFQNEALPHSFIQHFPCHYESLLKILPSVSSLAGDHVSTHPIFFYSEPFFALECFKSFFGSRKRVKFKHHPPSFRIRLQRECQMIEGLRFLDPLRCFEENRQKFFGGFFFVRQFK